VLVVVLGGAGALRAERIAHREKVRREGAFDDASFEREVDRIDDARAHLFEDDRAVVDEDLGLGAAAIDAERRTQASALDAELPGVIVEANDALAAHGPGELAQGACEIPEHARGVTLRDARGDVRSLDEEVEDLVRTLPYRAQRHRHRHGDRRVHLGPRVVRRSSAMRAIVGGIVHCFRFDEDLEASHSFSGRAPSARTSAEP